MTEQISSAEFRSQPGKIRKENPEDILQIQFTSFMQLQYPDVLHIHVANERRGMHKRQGANGKWFSPEGNKLKKKGVKAGVPDNLIFDPSEAAIPAVGLAIELKILPNKPSPEQVKFLSALQDRGWITGICYTLDAATDLVNNYFAKKKKQFLYTLPSDRKHVNRKCEHCGKDKLAYGGGRILCLTCKKFTN